MKLKRYLWIAVCLIALAVSVLPAYSQQFLQHHTGFQVSTLGALNVGIKSKRMVLPIPLQIILKQHFLLLHFFVESDRFV